MSLTDVPAVTLPSGSLSRRMISRPGREQGFALVGSLWAVLVLALVVAGITTTSVTEAKLTRTRIETAEHNALAEAMVNITILRLMETDASLLPPVDGTPFEVGFDGHAARVTVQDEGGKIDLNHAPAPLLLRLMLQQGLDASYAQEVVDRILDWREPGVGKRLQGAAEDDYRLAGLPYGPRRGPFETVEELKLVIGMTPGLFQALAPSLTVYAQTPWPNPDVAPRSVLEVMPGMNEDGIVKLLAARAGDARRGITSGAGVSALGSAFSIIVTLQERGSIQTTRSAVIRLTGSLAAPIRVYRWN